MENMELKVMPYLEDRMQERSRNKASRKGKKSINIFFKFYDSTSYRNIVFKACIIWLD